VSVFRRAIASVCCSPVRDVHTYCRRTHSLHCHSWNSRNVWYASVIFVWTYCFLL